MKFDTGNSEKTHSSNVLAALIRRPTVYLMLFCDLNNIQKINGSDHIRPYKRSNWNVDLFDVIRLVRLTLKVLIADQGQGQIV